MTCGHCESAVLPQLDICAPRKDAHADIVSRIVGCRRGFVAARAMTPLSGGKHAVDFRHDFAQVKRLGEHLGLLGRAGGGMQRHRGKTSN